MRDEGETIVGGPRSRAWKEDTNRKYQHTVEPIDVEREGRTIVVAKVSGNFPGSPVEP